MSGPEPPRSIGDGVDERPDIEQRRLADRLWAYSDAVFAVIVTIMVLQLRPPKSHHFAGLLGLWPTAVSYVASYFFIAIIWLNYHHLTRFVRNLSLGLVWLNFFHLFVVSLVPFATAWVAQSRPVRPHAAARSWPSCSSGWPFSARCRTMAGLRAGLLRTRAARQARHRIDPEPRRS